MKETDGSVGNMKQTDEWINDSIRWHGRLLTGHFAHWCGDWDLLPIDETCGEFQACTCSWTEKP